MLIGQTVVENPLFFQALVRERWRDGSQRQMSMCKRACEQSGRSKRHLSSTCNCKIRGGIPRHGSCLATSGTSHAQMGKRGCFNSIPKGDKAIRAEKMGKRICGHASREQGTTM